MEGNNHGYLGNSHSWGVLIEEEIRNIVNNALVPVVRNLLTINSLPE